MIKRLFVFTSLHPGGLQTLEPAIHTRQSGFALRGAHAVKAQFEDFMLRIRSSS